ncbi:hypothetical protein [Pseudomonas sp. E102]|uniref:hypothetical protein n=1 Tax=Pseudomonas sp. E102 TaxID=181579 RepID=UPI004045D217
MKRASPVQLRQALEVAPKTVIVERHRYVSDWFETDKVEMDLEHTTYEFQYRFGPDWYLEAKRYDPSTDTWVSVEWSRGNSFNLSAPAYALAALGGRVTKFTCISAGMQFHKALAELLVRAKQMKSRAYSQAAERMALIAEAQEKRV